MTPGLFVLMLVISISILIVLIMKCKVHPMVGLFAAAVFLGITTQNGVVGTLDIINVGFGSTLTGIGIPIILGSILAMAIKDTGAAAAITNMMIRLFRGKHLELAPALTGYIMSIPVFGDITLMLCTPIASLMSRRKKISMSQMAMCVNTAQALTYGLVPPTPGILAVSIMLAADLGTVIGFGIVISMTAFFVVWLVLHKWADKEWIDPRPQYVHGIEPAPADGKLEDLYIQEENQPGALESLMPFIVPIVLIMGHSFAGAFLPETNPIMPVLAVLGNKVTSLLMGILFAVLLAAKRKGKVIAEANASGGTPYTSLFRVITDNWVSRGLQIALMPLLVTAMGGAFSRIITANPVVKELGGMVVAWGVPGILIPFLIAVVMMTAVGSMTTAAMTSAAIVLPMLPTLGLSPVSAALALSSGCLIFNHVNNSGFWIAAEFFNLNLKQALKYLSIPLVVAGVMSFLLVALFTSIGIM